MPKLTQITKINRDGGPGYRLTAVQDSAFIDQEELDQFKRLRIAVATPFGLISSPYSLEPKAHSSQGHNICKGSHPDFPSLFDFIIRHTFRKVKRFEKLNALKKELEIELKIIPLKFWKGEGILALIPGDQDSPDLTPLSCVRNYVTPTFKDSLEQLYENDKREFINMIREACALYKTIPNERDIYTLDYFLRYIGIRLQHFRVGIDSPTAVVEFTGKKKNKKLILPVELKTHSKRFYQDARAPKGKGMEKYGQHVPLTILCLRHNSKDWKRDSGIGVIALEDLLRLCSQIASVRIRLSVAA